MARVPTMALGSVLWMVQLELPIIVPLGGYQVTGSTPVMPPLDTHHNYQKCRRDLYHLAVSVWPSRLPCKDVWGEDAWEQALGDGSAQGDVAALVSAEGGLYLYANWLQIFPPSNVWLLTSLGTSAPGKIITVYRSPLPFLIKISWKRLYIILINSVDNFYLSLVTAALKMKWRWNEITISLMFRQIMD